MRALLRVLVLYLPAVKADSGKRGSKPVAPECALPSLVMPMCVLLCCACPGNLVTNASWEHFWLNEGWTVFLERKIVGRLQVRGRDKEVWPSNHSTCCQPVAGLNARHHRDKVPAVH